VGLSEDGLVKPPKGLRFPFGGCLPVSSFEIKRWKFKVYKKEEAGMKKFLYTSLFLMVGMMLSGIVWSGDKEAMEKRAMKKQVIEKQIMKQVDEVVAAIDSGKKAEDFKKLATELKYYVYILEESGHFLVHPDLKFSSGLALKGQRTATTEGIWIEYDHYGLKRSYVKKTKGGLIVGSAYYLSELEDAK
jgi:hypothetical protein